jgi:hypothetical protein
VTFTERNELVEALSLDRKHEPLGDRIQVRALGRELEALDACVTVRPFGADSRAAAPRPA